MVPGHLVPHNGSPINWSPCTNSPQPIQSHGQMVPKNLVPMDKRSPTNPVRLDKHSLKYSICPGGQAVGIWKYKDRIDWGPFVQGDQTLGDHFYRGIIFMYSYVQGHSKLGTNTSRHRSGYD